MTDNHDRSGPVECPHSGAICYLQNCRAGCLAVQQWRHLPQVAPLGGAAVGLSALTACTTTTPGTATMSTETSDAPDGSFSTVEIRPPREHDTKFFHHLRSAECVDQFGQWDGSRWRVFRPCSMSWSDDVPPASLAGWRYLGPAEWVPMEASRETKPKETAEQENAELRRRIAELEAKIATLRAHPAMLADPAADAVMMWREASRRLLPGLIQYVAPSSPNLLPPKLDPAEWFGHPAHEADATVPLRPQVEDDLGVAQSGETISTGNPVARPSAIRAGEFVTCENGHLVCEVVHDPEPDRVTAALGAWRGQAGAGCMCDQCGASWWRHDPALGFQVHIKGKGWV